mgnify:CR=1 FL=1
MPISGPTTPAGEGKTTISLGLTEALNQKGISAIAALREPSLGPCFGIKGGAAGGGYAQAVPVGSSVVFHHDAYQL